MRSTLIILLVNLVSSNLIGQVLAPYNGEIEVIGYSHIEIIPDEIFYSVEISDYQEGKEIIQIEELDKQFWNLISESKIPIENIEIDNTSSRKLNYKRNKSQIIRSKTYLIKFSDIEKLDKLAEKLENIKISKSGIVGVNISNLAQLEEELKIEAIKNAKEKAEKLLNSLNEELGKVKYITEIYENDYRNYLVSEYYKYLEISQSVQSGFLSESLEPDVKYKKVKLGTTIKVIFEIK